MSYKLIGVDATTDIGATLSGGYLICTRFQCTTAGNMVQFRIKIATDSNVKFAIYSDGTTKPDALLASVGSTACTTGWNTITITSTALTLNTYYWLLVISETTQAIGYNGGGTGGYGYLDPGYAASFPDPYGSTQYVEYGGIIVAAGWDTVITPIKKITGVVTASVKKVGGVAVASIKKVGTVSNE